MLQILILKVAPHKILKKRKIRSANSNLNRNQMAAGDKVDRTSM